ncbi:uncharacterized protein LOC133424185 [Cololabis saira]|uniref:uncharacterized protein LOC133424185 n=1 Tax=Cololabis saira TaxID=129043 RepID=UPI002AD528E7|nr:uncharacterized protein LOC133424185 [Cololabis saira]
MSSVPPGQAAGPSTQNVDHNWTVAAAAQSLINVLTQNRTQGQQVPERKQEQGSSSVEQEMARSFPGFFTKKSQIGKRKNQGLNTCGTGSRKAWRPFSFYVYLLNINSEMTPTSPEEFELAQAGLGKRYLNLSKDVSHEEFFTLLKHEYPKMQEVTGGWLLYKATGGQGKRRLTTIPPDSDGYTGTLIRSVTGTGKSTLYIVPLQHTFDPTPLPPDSIEFQSMPKAQCQTCKVNFPLQILALHVQECMESAAGDIDTCQHEVQIVSVTAPPVHCDTETPVEEKVPCPICFMNFTPQFLEFHASACGERKEDLEMPETSAMIQDNVEEQLKRTVGQILAVKLSTEHSIGGLSDEIFNCGYTGAISVQNKESIIGAIILHAVLRLQPMLEQLREGRLYDLLSLIRQYPDICQPLFVPGEDVKVNAEFVMASILPQLSDKGTSRHQVELEMMNFVQDFLYEVEDASSTTVNSSSSGRSFCPNSSEKSQS